MNTELTDLQDSIAMVDLMTRNTNNQNPLLEVLVKRLRAIQIRMEPDSHKTPHVHISCGTDYHSASYSIHDGTLIVGERSKYEETIKTWIIENHDDLLKLWKQLKAGEIYEETIGKLMNSEG